MHDVTITGLDGSNPLGFLAALGVLDATTDGESLSRLRWAYEGVWRPVLASACASIDELVARLDTDRIACTLDPALALEYDGKADLKPPPKLFREFLRRLRDTASTRHRRSVDWASAFATDVAVDNNGNTKPTALHFTAGQQQFLQMARQLAEQVTRDDLREALQGPWTYSRPLPVMGWDGTSSRDYALRARDPSTEKKLGVPGADWLALRGLTLLPTVPRGNRVLTTCCTGGWKDGFFRWPLWTAPLNREVAASLLRLEVVSRSRPERVALGIGAVFTAGIRRSDQGGYGSFEPASST